ncbi:hypothetical protein [uncultured Gammaproteobacteria bacterium]|nr:hypothetical protein [uncultured Gammaproteobacteria bacterium]
MIDYFFANYSRKKLLNSTHLPKPLYHYLSQCNGLTILNTKIAS